VETSQRQHGCWPQPGQTRALRVSGARSRGRLASRNSAGAARLAPSKSASSPVWASSGRSTWRAIGQTRATWGGRCHRHRHGQRTVPLRVLADEAAERLSVT
jgi:hypothetical protein